VAANNSINISVKVIFALSLFLFLFGSFAGFKKDLGECSDIPDNEEGQKMDCYHIVAVTQAIIYKDKGAATDACEKMYTEITLGSSKNIKNIGESKRNICLYDVAKALRDPTVCAGIKETSSLSIFTGSVATQEICKRTAEQLKKANTQNYFNDPNNICALVFIFPLTFIFYYFGSRP